MYTQCDGWQPDRSDHTCLGTDLCTDVSRWIPRLLLERAGKVAPMQRIEIQAIPSNTKHIRCEKPGPVCYARAMFTVNDHNYCRKHAMITVRNMLDNYRT